ncbi:MAG: hypothetical protein ACYS8W_20805, partial [Planctomycetota bacterium]
MKLSLSTARKLLLAAVAAALGLALSVGVIAGPQDRKKKPGSKSDVRKIAKDIIKYLRLKDEKKREKQFKVIERNSKNKAFLTAEIAADSSFYPTLKHKSGWSEMKTRHATRIGVYVPRGYSPVKPMPLLVGLHHSEQGEPWKDMCNVFLKGELETRKYLAVFPIHPGFGWANEKAGCLIVNAIEHMIEHYNVNVNRVYLLGYGFGANGVWYQACFRPTRYAAVASLAGCLKDDCLPNAANVPIYAVAATDDKATPPSEVEERAKQVKGFGGTVVVEEVPGGPEQPSIRAAVFNAKLRQRIFDFFDKNVRKQFPKKFKWKIPVRGDTIAFYLGFGDQWKGTVEAEVISGNRIDITTKEVKGLTLLISDRLFNLEQPIEVYINEKRMHFENVEPSLTFL